MKVSWSKGAIKSMTHTSMYILNEFGNRANMRFLQEIQKVSDLMEENPFMGQVEPLLIGKSKEYRSVVVNRQNKIVYYVKGNTIRVSALWDTRREPKSLAKEVK